MGVQIQYEFIYPLEDVFIMYLPDYFNDSPFVIQGNTTSLSDCIVSHDLMFMLISSLVSIIMEIVLLIPIFSLLCDIIIYIQIQKGR